MKQLTQDARVHTFKMDLSGSNGGEFLLPGYTPDRRSFQRGTFTYFSPLYKLIFILLICYGVPSLGFACAGKQVSCLSPSPEFETVLTKNGLIVGAKYLFPANQAPVTELSERIEQLLNNPGLKQTLENVIPVYVKNAQPHQVGNMLYETPYQAFYLGTFLLEVYPDKTKENIHLNIIPRVIEGAPKGLGIFIPEDCPYCADVLRDLAFLNLPYDLHFYAFNKVQDANLQCAGSWQDAINGGKSCKAKDRSAEINNLNLDTQNLSVLLNGVPVMNIFDRDEYTLIEFLSQVSLKPNSL